MKGLLVLLFVCLCGWAVAQPVPDTAGWQIADATYDLIAVCFFPSLLLSSFSPPPFLLLSLSFFF